MLHTRAVAILQDARGSLLQVGIVGCEANFEVPAADTPRTPAEGKQERDNAEREQAEVEDADLSGVEEVMT